MSLLLSTLYQRTCSLIVGNASGGGLDLSHLRVTFTVNRADVQTPANAIIRVYNPNPETVQTVQQEYKQVYLQAGYGGTLGLIFSGGVRQVRHGRENQVDTFMEIVAQDGDTAYNFATMGQHNGTGTLGAGWKQDDLHAAILKALDPYGVTQGYTPTFGGPSMPRAKVCYGMARDYLRTLAEGCGSSWHVSDGALNMVPMNGTLPGEAVEVNKDTGMIGMPQQTINGITVRSLLNPKIKHGGQIKLDNNSIQLAQMSVAVSALNQFPGIDSNGIYKVFAITMHGDTRGQEWYSDLICTGLDATAPLSNTFTNSLVSGTGY